MRIYTINVLPYIIKLTATGYYNVIIFKSMELDIPARFIFNSSEEVERTLCQNGYN